MQYLRVYDYLTLSRGTVFGWVRGLSDAQYRELQFPIGLGSVGRTLTHIMICEWFYVQRLTEREVGPYVQWPIQDEKPPGFDVLETTWTKQAGQTRAAIAAVSDWSTRIEYRTLADPGESEAEQMIITASAGDIVTQMILHEMHHRAQALNMLRQLGVTMQGDIDFNALMYERRVVGE